MLRSSFRIILCYWQSFDLVETISDDDYDLSHDDSDSEASADIKCKLLLILNGMTCPLQNSYTNLALPGS